jgi:predicted metalloprotease
MSHGLGKGEESENLEDRRRVSPRTLAVGGGVGAVVVLQIAAFLGVDPQKVNRFLGNAHDGGPSAAGRQAEERPPTAEEERSRRFASKILRFTEKVWDEQFRKAGKRYEPPHMVLFTAEVETGCGNAPSAVGQFYCPADKTVYLDPTFFDDLEKRLDGSKAR